MIFYGLLYVSSKDQNPNLRLNNKKNSFQVYLKNAENLYLSLKKKGLKFKIITNNKKKIKKNLNFKIEVQEIKFNTYVPKDINFYSAHYKIDVYRYFSLKKGYHALIDLDMLAINSVPNIFKFYLKNKINLLFNLNSNYKKKNKIHNKKILNSLKICNRLENNTAEWYGGEFVVGNHKFFNYIYKTIKTLYKNYLANYKRLHHQGDEMLLNSSIQVLKHNRNFKFKDISNNKIITRYWSINTISKQRPLSFHLKHFLIHLPADKIFLSNIDILEDTHESIKLKVSLYLNSNQKKIINFIKKIISTLLFK